MTETEARKQGFLPVYSRHAWEVLAIIKSLQGLQDRRKAQGKESKLDSWLDDFIRRLNNIAAVMITSNTDTDGICYLHKDDRELLRQLIRWVQDNGLI